MSKAITRQQVERLEEKLPLRGGVICCSQRESENAIEQLIREAKKQLSAAPDHRTKDWMHVASNLQSLTESWKGSLNMWLGKGMLTGGPRDCDIFLDLHGAVRNLRNSLAQKKDGLKVKKGGISSGETRQKQKAAKEKICIKFWEAKRLEYDDNRSVVWRLLEELWDELVDEEEWWVGELLKNTQCPRYKTFADYLAKNQKSSLTNRVRA